MQDAPKNFIDRTGIGAQLEDMPISCLTYVDSFLCLRENELF